jgi:hypothetical protein
VIYTPSGAATSECTANAGNGVVASEMGYIHAMSANLGGNTLGPMSPATSGVDGNYNALIFAP